jgi:hypothetical protein
LCYHTPNQPEKKDTFSMQSSHTFSDLSVMFDDDHAVANAGLALAGLLSEKLGLEQLCDERISVGPFPGRRAATLVHSLVVGGTCIDDADVLRSGSTAAVLSHRVMAPSTLGTFLREFTFGNVRQLDSVTEQLLTRAWALGAGPGDSPMTIDIDSTICEVHGAHKQGAGYGYTHVLGYHPVLATRADTGEVLHLRFRKGSANTQRGAQRFVRETVGRVRRAGASGTLTLRADSGFFSKYVVMACRDHDVRYSITVRQTPVITRAIEQIDEEDWTSIDYTANGEAWVAETDYQGQRLIVRRTKLNEPRPALFPDYRYHAFVTDRVGDAVLLDVDHRRHAVVELAIRDLKEGSGLEHCPSGDFNANAAWAVLASIAHNLVRWVAALGLGVTGPLVAKTIRRKFITVPGRLTNHARRRHLHLPTHWPWAAQWSACFARLVKLQT